LLCIAICGFARRRGDTREGAFVFGVCGSAVIYLLSYYPVGVASDFRYAYWAVVAGLVGGVVASAPSRQTRS
jgi:membrane associated rhomboid family serine protease